MITIKFKQARQEMSFDLPLTMGQWEAIKNRVKEKIASRPKDAMLDTQPESNGYVLAVADDLIPKLDGFDRLILARALCIKKVKVSAA